MTKTARLARMCQGCGVHAVAATTFYADGRVARRCGLCWVAYYLMRWGKTGPGPDNPREGERR